MWPLLAILVLFAGHYARAEGHEEYVCGPLKRQCLENSTCNPVDNECQCPHGLTGDGQLECCNPNKERMCVVDADPHVTTWEGARADVTLPCWYRISAFYVPTLDPFCELMVEIMAVNTLTYDGLFYIHKIRIEISLCCWKVDEYQKCKNRRVFFLSVREIWNALGGNPWTYGRYIDLKGNIIYFSWVYGDNIAVCQVNGVRIKFRAYDPELRPQLQKPGLSVVIPFTVERFIGDQQGYGVCMVPTDSVDVFRDAALAWSIRPPSLIALYFALMQRGVMKLNNVLCRKVKRTMKKCDRDPRMVMKYCGFIINYRRVVRKIQKARLDPMKLFKTCVQWVCKGRRKKCRGLHRTLGRIGSDTVAIFRTVGCSLKRLEKANERLYGGQ